jgi:alpha-ribazole phosphatase
MQTLTFYFVRHAPVIGQDGIAYGRDALIDETCTDKFESAAAQLPKDNALWVTSEFPRAQRTAALLQQTLGIHVPSTPDAAFNEQDFGDLIGRHKREIAVDPINAAYIADMVNVAPPNGESVPAMVQRVGDGLQALAGDMKALGQDKVVIVCHGGVIRSAKSIHDNEAFDLHMKAPHLSVHKFEMTV